MIQLEGIWKSYHADSVETQALKDVSLEIKKGEFVAIMGASGSGKSTLMSIMGLMNTADKGSYRLDDTEISALKAKALEKLRREKIAVVFQNFALMHYCSVYENVELPLIAKKLPQRKRKAIVLEKLAHLGIEELARKKAGNISGGQQQRVAIARALAADTDYIFADEPTGALDSVTGMELMKIFQRIHEEGKTLVMVTHDEKIAACAGRIVRLEDGRIV